MMTRAAAEVAEVCAKENLKRPNVIGVTVLTSSNASMLAAVGINADVNAEVEQLAVLVKKCGLNGVVALHRNLS